MSETANKTIKDYTTKSVPTWCPSCGNFNTLTALKLALAKLNLEPQHTVLVSGIGCGSLMPYWLKTYGLCTLHGRPIAVATGVKIANHQLKVIVNSGDGDTLGIGIGHYIHFFRRNLDITIIIDDNGVYGLTKGQTSPSSPQDSKTSSTPFGSIETPVNSLALAISAEATFVARACTENLVHLSQVLKLAISHKGSAVVQVLQTCPTFNKQANAKFYQNRLTEVNTPFTNKQIAYEFLSKNQEEKIPIGIFWQETQITYEDHLPQIKEQALVKHNIDNIDVSNFWLSRS